MLCSTMAPAAACGGGGGCGSTRDCARRSADCRPGAGVERGLL